MSVDNTARGMAASAKLGGPTTTAGIAAGALAGQIAQNTLSARPATPYIGLFAHSLAANSHATNADQPGVLPPAEVVATTRDAKLASGFAGHLEALTGGRVELPRKLNYGITGQTTAQMAARAAADMAKIAARGGSFVIIPSPITNDPGGSITPAQSLANVASFLAAAKASGLGVIMTNGFPRADTVNNVGIALSGAALRQFQYTSAELLKFHNGRDVFVVNVWAALGSTDATNSAKGYLKDNLSFDGLHLNTNGSRIVAEILADIINQIWPVRNFLPLSAADTYHATDNPSGVKTPNPMLFGTGGTKAAGVTGELADNWAQFNVLPAGLSIACAKLTDSDGLPVQQFTISGTPPASAVFGLLQYRIAIGTQGIAVGSDLSSVMHLEIDGGATGLYAVQPKIIAGGLNLDAMGSDPNAANSRMPTKLFSGPVKPDSLTVPVGATGNVETALQAYFSGSAVNAVIRVKRYGLIPTSRLTPAVP